jgi:hypothetical protein
MIYISIQAEDLEILFEECLCFNIFYEPICIATNCHLLRRTLVRSYRLLSKPQSVFTCFNHSFS